MAIKVRPSDYDPYSGRPIERQCPEPQLIVRMQSGQTIYLLGTKAIEVRDYLRSGKAEPVTVLLDTHPPCELTLTPQYVESIAWYPKGKP